MGIAVPSQLLGRQHNNHPIQITIKAAAADHLNAKAATYATYGYGLPLAGGIWKRDAEAEPWLGYGLAGWAPATGSPVAPLVAHPDGNVTPPHTPAVQAAAADHLATKAAAYGWGLPLAGLWKREAEAEPW